MSSNQTLFRQEYRPKQLRVKQACDPCHRMKSEFRCSGSQALDARCIACIESNRDCAYTEPAKKKASRKSYANSLEARLEHSEALIRQLRSQLATAHFNNISAGSSSANSASPLKIRNPSNQAVPVTPSTFPIYLGIAVGSLADPPPPPDRDDLIHVDLSANFEKLHVDSAHQRGFIGKSSGDALVKVALELKEEVRREHRNRLSNRRNHPEEELFPWTSRRMHFWTFKSEKRSFPHNPSFRFPPLPLMNELVGLYFTQQNIYVPLLHRPTFDRSIAEGCHFSDTGFASTLLLVCAIGSRWSADPSVVSMGANNGVGSLGCGWEWFDQVWPPTANLFGQTTLYDLQYYYLAAQFLEGGSDQKACWMLIGIGLRLALNIGLHRRTAHVETPSVQRELFKRAFWALVYLDRTVSCSMGRTCAVQNFDLDLDLPIECDDDYWEHPTHPFQQPAGVASHVLFFNALLRLNNLLSGCLKLLYPLNKIRRFLHSDDSWAESLVVQLNSALSDWYAQMPEHLRWDAAQTDSVFFDQSAALHCAYYRLRILIEKSGPTTVFSLAVCTNAARACADIVDTQRRRKGNVPVVINLPAAFLSGVVLLLNMWSCKRMRLAPDLSSEIAGVHKCIAAVRLCEDRWQSAGLLWDILAELAFVGQVSLPNGIISNVHQSSEPPELPLDTAAIPPYAPATQPSFPDPDASVQLSTGIAPAPISETWLPTKAPFPTTQMDLAQASRELRGMMDLLDSDAMAMWINTPMGLEVDDWGNYFKGFNDVSQNFDQNSESGLVKPAM
ncbi:fungal-specific transcription factor domain-containing protein [Mycena alexandri]|uniref:Fungal-specific transcription factor domain-containing protein n=1 Tax=Mycena alexandri TaxID=1745969 RepID=A0AAD6SFS0_9AGAR|nr:fungal-specific transcription factor domain-containing protein [Mycena alexandri]